MTDSARVPEEQLKVWRKATSEGNRFRVARELKKQGRKVIGVVSDYVPEEAIYAAGMLPWRIIGAWREDVAQATLHRPVNAEVYATHVLESLLAGELDFLDGIVIPHLDDDQRRLWDVCVHLDMMPLIHYLYIPRKESEYCLTEFAGGIRRLVGELEQLGAVKVSQESLRQAIGVYNKWRRCLMAIYELRKREVPPLSGSEVLSITTASFTMLKEEFTQQVEAVFGQLKKRKTSLSRVRPRILVSSENLDDPAYLELVEDAGCLVAMDDLDTGSRYIWQEVDTSMDPFYGLAKRYLSRPTGPQMFDWDKQANQVMQWVKEFKIDGVLNFPTMNSYWREMFTPYFHSALSKAGTPMMTFSREYQLANVGQLRTRIEAFLETL